MQFFKECKRSALLFACILLLQGCATSSDLIEARAQFKHGSAGAALQTLSQAEVSSRDQLLLHLDTALVAQAAEQYKQSIASFEKAYQLIEHLDYVSLRDQSAAILSNDWAIRYSGEISERLWIHTFQMINFMMLNDTQGAAVEARRAVALFEEHPDVLEADLLSRYLTAISFEAAGQFDSAGVEYRKLNQQRNVAIPSKRSSNTKDVVVLVASGFIQPKLPGDLTVDIDARIAFPIYPVIADSPPTISINANSEPIDTFNIHTRLLSVAREALAKRGTSIAARQALRLIAKKELARNIGEEDPLAGSIAQLLFFALEQADTRSWETLPAWVSLLRVKVPADTEIIDIRINTSGELETAEHEHSVILKKESGSMTFEAIRVGINKALPNENLLVVSP